MRVRVIGLSAAAALAVAGAALHTPAQRKATPRQPEQTAPKKVTSRPEDQGKTDGPSSSLVIRNAIEVSTSTLGRVARAQRGAMP